MSEQPWPKTILLDTPEGCEQELMRCTNGMAWLDHAYTLAVDARDGADEVWEDWESKAAVDCAVKGMTATELRAKITCWVSQRPEAGAARQAQRRAHTDLEKIARFYRTAEQRATNAQAALKKHLGGARYGGRE